MNFITTLFIAFGLSMDAFAVSVSNGIAVKKFKPKFAIKVSTLFGFFQAAMPFLGWLLCYSTREYIESFDHWIAFALLGLIGAKMIKESFEEKESSEEPSISKLIVLAIATSIDALAIGITLTVLKIDIFYPCFIIGIITFLLSFTGVYLGTKFGKLFSNKVEIIGGIILIGIGTKILIEHLYFS